MAATNFAEIWQHDRAAAIDDGDRWLLYVNFDEHYQPANIELDYDHPQPAEQAFSCFVAMARVGLLPHITNIELVRVPALYGYDAGIETSVVATWPDG
jgi:hypothetical protein